MQPGMLGVGGGREEGKKFTFPRGKIQSPQRVSLLNGMVHSLHITQPVSYTDDTKCVLYTR